jgi:hypothetical protein
LKIENFFSESFLPKEIQEKTHFYSFLEKVLSYIKGILFS